MDTLAELIETQEPIRAAFERWLRNETVTIDEIEALHRRAAVAAHRHYCARVPAYRSLAEDLGATAWTDGDKIRAELSSTDHFFKAYDEDWLDAGDFESMTRWLERIYCEPIPIQTAGITSAEAWMDALEAAGVHVLYTSGTSGQFSFIPRDARTHGALMKHSLQQSFTYYAQHDLDPRECDAFLLSFHGGRLGNASVADGLGELALSETFLLECPIDADMVRASIRGAAPPALAERYERFRRETVERMDAHYRRVLERLKRSTSEGRPALLYGPPFQILDLCSRLEAEGSALALHPRSFMIMTGGWKSFEGERIPRRELVDRLVRWLGLDPARLAEAYGMSECNIVYARCAAGRFHIPPLIWPFVADAALYPIAGHGLGRFGYSDPFASSYPGLFLSSDELELSTDACRCGRSGFSITGEVHRAPGQEVKGCGGVMASVRA